MTVMSRRRGGEGGRGVRVGGGEGVCAGAETSEEVDGLGEGDLDMEWR